MRKDVEAEQVQETMEAFLAVVKRLLLEKELSPEWAQELIDRDMTFLERGFSEGALPLAAAFEIYITEDEDKREPPEKDDRLKLDMPKKVEAYLSELVDIGLWGGSVEDVALTLIQQQVAAKLAAGVLSKKKLSRH